MRYLGLILASALTAGIGIAQKLRSVAFSKIESGITTRTNNGPILLRGREQLVDVIYPSGRGAKGDVLVLFDHATGIFLWNYWEAYGKAERRP